MDAMKRRAKLKLCVELSVVCAIIVMLLVIFSLPLVFYGFQTSYNTQSTNGSTNFSCSPPLKYSSGICFEIFQDILRSWNCQVNNTDSILVAADNEAMAVSFINSLVLLNPSSECEESVLPFLCLYIFGFCTDDVGIIQPTKGQCEDIKFRACSEEFQKTISLGFELLDCNMLSIEQERSCPFRRDSDENVSSGTELNCQRNFFYDEETDTCLANCHTWSQNDETTSTFLHAIGLISNSVGLLLAIIALVVSVIRYRSMFHFPSLLMVYCTVDMVIIDFFFLLGYSNTSLFCSSPSFPNDTVTPFCIVNGIVFVYSILQLDLWWVFHSSILSWSVWFPFHYEHHKTTGKLKHVCVIFTIFGLFIPVIPITIIMAYYAPSQNESILSESFGFFPWLNPPIFCVPRGSVLGFFTFLLPGDVILATGGIILIITFYGFHKSNKLMGVAKKKLMLALCYYVIVSDAVVIALAVVIRDGQALIQAIAKYLICESKGINPDSPCDKSFQQYGHSIILSLTQTVLALYPIHVLIFVVNIRELKQFCKSRIMPKCFSSL